MVGEETTQTTAPRPDIVVLGLLPPPVTGASKNTLLMLEELRTLGHEATGIPTNATGTALGRSIPYHLKRISHFLKVRKRLSRLGGPSSGARLYFVPDGGLGCWYSAGYAAIARSRFTHVALHHRTFQYIDRPSGAMKRICAALDGRLTHVLLSPRMKDKFQAVYGSQSAIVSTNARYVEARRPAKPADQLSIGHLSNLCAAKGFFEVVETFERLRAAGIPVHLHLAGPVVEDRVQKEIDRLQRLYPNELSYAGPLYSAEKDRFYDGLHVFLFPTHWVQEAQPNVIYEAFAGGAAVVANQRGCIAEMIAGGDGIAVDRPSRFADEAVAFCSAYWADRASVPERVSRLASNLEREIDLSRQQHRQLLEIVKGEPVRGAHA